MEKICENCNKSFNGSHSIRKYCSLKCQGEQRSKERIELWKSGTWDGIVGYRTATPIRNYILNKFNHKCSKCGWGEVNKFSNTIPLELEHIDGDPFNNAESNLTILCPNCHALTKSYKGANKGSGRKERSKYYLKS